MTKHPGQDTARAPAPRRPWIDPSYARMRAGDAEGPGPNPDTIDIGFTKS